MSIAEKSLLLKEDFDKVYDAGKQAEYDAFWDGIQNYGKRSDYGRGFQNWGNEYIRPKYKIEPKTTQPYLFANCPKLKTVEPEYFDFSNFVATFGGYNQDVYAMYSRCSSLEIAKDLNIPACSYDYAFQYCTSLHTVEIMRVGEKSTFDGTFLGDSALKNILIEGVIGTNFHIHYSPLSVASLKNIVKHLKNYTGTTSSYAYTLTVKASAWQALEVEGFNDEDYDWIYDEFETTICDSWESLVSWLRWNLVLAQ